MKTSYPVRLVIPLAAAMMMGGCALTGTDRSITAAYERGDEDYLNKVCTGEISASSEAMQKYACNQRDSYRQRNAAQAATCDDVDQHYESNEGGEWARLEPLARKVAECGHWAFFFERVVHYGSAEEGLNLLIALEAAGMPVEAEFLKYLETHKGPQFFPVREDKTIVVQYGLMRIYQWLGTKNTPYCAEVSAAAHGSNPTALWMTIHYATEKKCREILPIAVDLLQEEHPKAQSVACELIDKFGDASTAEKVLPIAMELLVKENPHARKSACFLLGKFGDASMAEKVKTLADTDGYSEIYETPKGGAVKAYPVRDACLAAYGKFQLRK